jgi:hypothetical protein
LSVLSVQAVFLYSFVEVALIRNVLVEFLEKEPSQTLTNAILGFSSPTTPWTEG